MSRLLRQVPVGRRFYSSFSSSKPGGGRFFNSAKPPKSAVVATNSRKVDPTSNPNSASPADGNDGTQHAMNSTNSSLPVRNPLIQPVDVDATDASPASDPLASHADRAHAASHPTTFIHHIANPPHPTINVKEFNLHQFFSLHRPLLLLSHPPSILQSSPEMGPLFTSRGKPSNIELQSPPPVGLHGTISEENAGVSLDADVETARQLMRALTLHQAGGAVAWQDTLQRLGLDTEMDASQRKQMEQEWNEVMMDSTKRKRRKKMKKHKLKKRRRATRATRLKIGR